MDTVYRIYTEDTNRTQLLILVSSNFEGFTLYNATGYWKGVPESSLVIEILGTQDLAPKIKALAHNIRVLNKQECVLVTTAKVTGELI